MAPSNTNPVAVTDEVLQKSRVTVVGSGNWGSVAAKLIASNTLNINSFHGLFFFFLTLFAFSSFYVFYVVFFHGLIFCCNLDEVRMWVFEETVPSGEKLSEVINRTNVINCSVYSSVNYAF